MILADWSAGSTRIIYLFGSRVRGDHRPNSDVDIVIPFDRPVEADVHWWTAVNQECFASINARLPGPLRILDNNDPLALRIVAAGRANSFFQHRNVVCVWLPPHPK